MDSLEITKPVILNEAISTAVQRIKSFSPGEVYEFLQARFPLQMLKSKAHAKTASSLIHVLHDLLDNADLEKNEINQIKLYEKTLQAFIDQFEATLKEEELACEEVEMKPKKVRFAYNLLNRLKESAEAEKKNMFQGLPKSAESSQIVEAKYKKIKGRVG